MMKKRRLMKMVFSILLVSAVLLTSTVKATVTQYDKVADPSTINEYKEWLNNGTQNSGDVWTDKSVSSQAVSYNGKTFTPGENNFVVGLSAMSQAYSVTSTVQVPTDTVFVLDMSSSMTKTVEGTNKNRLQVLVESTNQAIEKLLDMNEYNRVGVVAYSGIESNDKGAANVLSNLDTKQGHGNESANHLEYSHPASGVYVLTGKDDERKLSKGTNIHRGIYEGSKMLNEAAGTTVNINGHDVDRMPVLIVMSDGGATYSSKSGTGNTNADFMWNTPSDAADTQIGGNSFKAGNGFLAALTAAYYKNEISQHYSQETKVYTLGFALGDGDDDDGEGEVVPASTETQLARVTLNPKTYLSYDNSVSNEFRGYWEQYLNGQNFNMPIKSDTYIFTSGSNIYSSPESIKYNDKYWSADDADSLTGAFDEIVNAIVKEAPSYPTDIDDNDPNYAGHVHFEDPIGEYMEVKQVMGVLSHDNYTSGARFAKLVGDNIDEDNEELDEFYNSIRKRFLLLGNTVSHSDIETLVQNSVDYNQIQYTSDSSFSNILGWYSNNNNDYLGFAPYPEKAVLMEDTGDSTHQVPLGATKVVQSYTFWNDSVKQVLGKDANLMYMSVRVETDLADGSQVLKMTIPASLIPLTTIDIVKDENNNIIQQSSPDGSEVTNWSPHRLVYEVGLRSDINELNVEEKLSDSYKQANLVPNKEKEYNFYTNEWDRDSSEALTAVNLVPSENNSFYYFTKDTVLYTDKNGTEAKGSYNPSQTYYYQHTYYTYDVDGDNITNIKEVTVYRELSNVGDNSIGVNGDGSLYIKKGTEKEDALTNYTLNKVKNPTQTDNNAYHSSWANQGEEYTLLGNNGRLTLKAKESKEVYDENEVNIDGEVVTVGDTLTYTIYYVNDSNKIGDVLITDELSKGLTVIESSISDQGIYSKDSHSLTWNLKNIPVNQEGYVTFNAIVNDNAIDDNGQGLITNLAYVNHKPTYKVTNTVVEDPDKPVNPTDPEKPTEPSTPIDTEINNVIKTSDDTSIFIFIAVGVIAGGFILYSLYKRKK